MMLLSKATTYKSPSPPTTIFRGDLTIIFEDIVSDPDFNDLDLSSGDPSRDLINRFIKVCA